ncbi:PDR/VanB family oxidoreductase [Sphingomonas sp.]|uniref:PDR/VanB family oxidoreductase n=1 Tax=Sphingomonas sp. TaxID=28214 RepID=UPI0025CB90BD|nr:PDR/VanB family oxidoreductase [Sphingomonas sp.]
MSNQRRQMRVRSAESVAREVKALELVPVDGESLHPWAPGAHIRVWLPDGDTRAYSLIGSRSDDTRYSIAIRLDEHGRGGSRYMHALVPGDLLAISDPRNDFPLQQTATFHTLVAGGIGITPLMAMAEELSSDGRRFRLVYCARTPDHAAFLDQMQQRFGSNVVAHFDEGHAKRAFDIAKLLSEPNAGEHVYVCGPKGMVDAARRSTSHWPEGTFHTEIFTNAPLPTEDETDEGFEIVLGSSDEKLQVPPGKSILRVLLEKGLPVEYYCEQGSCGLCTTGILSGLVEHRDVVLNDEEKASQKIMQVCVSRPLPGEVLVLDL